MASVGEVCSEWLQLSRFFGWGVEGPLDGDRVRDAVIDAAAGRLGEEEAVWLTDLVNARALGTSPVDCLWSAAAAIAETSLATESRRQELLASARGWLRIATE